MAKSYEMHVKIVEIREKQQVSEKFVKREVIGMIEGEYPEHYCFEFVQKNVDIPEDLMEDTYVTVHFNIKGRKVAGAKKTDPDKFFTSLQGWKVEAKKDE